MLSHFFHKLTMKTSPLSEHDFLVFHGMTELPSVTRLAKEAKEANEASIAAEANEEYKEAKEANEAAEAADAADNAKKGKCQTKISEYFDIAIYRPSLTYGPSICGA